MTVSEQIIQVIDALCEKFGIVIDWTSENVIPYIETLCGKLIAYEIATSIAWMVIMMLLSVGSIIAAKKLYPIFKKKIAEADHWTRGDWELVAGFAIAALVIINLVAVIVVGTQIMDIIKCLTFPEMYIIEYVSELLSSPSN